MRQSSRAIVIKDDQFLLMKRLKFGKEFYSLIGGEIEPGEKPVEGLIRELEEEASITISNPKLVIIEDAGEIFGMQYIFVCDFQSGEPKLGSNSTEAKISEGGVNTYQPMWVKTADLSNLRLLPVELKDLIIKFIKEGFPEEPEELKIDDIQTI